MPPTPEPQRRQPELDVAHQTARIVDFDMLEQMARKVESNPNLTPRQKRERLSALSREKTREEIRQGEKLFFMSKDFPTEDPRFKEVIQNEIRHIKDLWETTSYKNGVELPFRGRLDEQLALLKKLRGFIITQVLKDSIVVPLPNESYQIGDIVDSEIDRITKLINEFDKPLRA